MFSKKINLYFFVFFFMISIFLQIFFSLNNFFELQPSWIFLNLIYWILIFPKKINIIYGFFLGNIMDIISSPIFGIYALIFSIMSYFLIFVSEFFFKILLWKKMLLIFSFLILQHFILSFFQLWIIQEKITYIFLIKKILNSILDTFIFFFCFYKKIKKIQ